MKSNAPNPNGIPVGCLTLTALVAALIAAVRRLTP